MAVTSFAAFTLFALAELTHHHPSFLLADVLQGDTHAGAQWALLLAVPATSAAACSVAKAVPNFYAHILTASILHQIPLARDVLHFYGSREVTRTAFAHTLQQKESVLLVPGGQAEMLQQQSAKREVRIYTHHKGFIRLAIEHGVPLVPVLSFKEGEMMDNVQAPMLQRWFVKKLAFPFPYFPYGRGMLPIPRKVDIPIVVGKPLEVPHIEKPTQDDIDKVHSKYFAVLQEMFDKYKDEVGCGDYKLVLI
ncbi:hypothetical protein AM588_10008006 [Phytophthora nicotianae]|uniref:Acyltransferase n=1 Tax=Phytophthora nicotianae TaxID=4792 RepID=A0A0W8D7B8_PHYNI|nr:hypothetical protein AM588_10008006 [Phytophthora nicotianae]